jgi:hypothetical protein
LLPLDLILIHFILQLLLDGLVLQGDFQGHDGAILLEDLHKLLLLVVIRKVPHDYSPMIVDLVL